MKDYYEKTKMPVSIEMIEERLRKKEFPTMTSLESYWKRLVQNAKEYNQRDSIIHRDAERIRKRVLTFMEAHNPAYENDPEYKSFPTPLPGDDSQELGVPTPPQEEEIDADGESDHEMTGTDTRASEVPSEAQVPAKRRPGRKPKDRDASATPAVDRITVEGDFEELTFQEAQEKLIKELMEAEA
jgi:hypothetical protein